MEKIFFLKYKLLLSDALIASTCMSSEITKIVNFYKNFDIVDFLELIDMT